MELVLFITTLVVVAYFLLRRDVAKSKVFMAAPTDNPCRPHQWGRLSDVTSPELAIEVSAILKDNDNFKDSLIDIVASNLICTKCGYVSGSELSVNLDLFPEAVKGFVESERAAKLQTLTKDLV